MSFYKIGFYKFFLNLNKIQKNSMSNIIQYDKPNKLILYKNILFKQSSDKSFKYKYPFISWALKIP